ncbi:MAG TPA: alpha/beta hydrolase-fold protein [Thermoanaerobaculia bacterium]|nr:alpha/beta hydrolase-fold protein [Thermoanaerobaculia bacterium]
MILAAIVTTAFINGMHLERELGPADEHTYTAQLSAGSGVVGEADQEGVDLVVDVIDPDGKELKTLDSPNGAFGPEPIDFTAVRSGTFKFVVHTLNKDAKPGKYVMKIDQLLDPAANADRLAKLRYDSPALYDLWRAALTDRHAIENFVASRKGKGPIIEPVPNDPTDLRVTYLFFTDEHTEAVRENGGPHAAAGGMLMHRFLDTPLFYATEIVPNDSRYSYGFAWIETQSVGAVTVSEDHFDKDPLNPNAFGPYSVMTMPEAPAQPYTIAHDDVPKGMLTPAKIDSAAMKESREFVVYTPHAYDGKAENDLLVTFDAGIYGASPADALIPTPTILDNLIAAKKIGPTIALLIRNPNRNRDLGINPAFADFVANELVPWARKNYRIADGPQHVVVTGSSRGGFAAAYCALRHPEAIGNVLSQSGSFWIVKDYNGGPPRYPFSERSGDLIADYQSAKKLPIRFYIDIGRFDNGIAMLPMNRELRDVLMAKGYDVTYNEFDSGHDYIWWRGSLADGLIALIGH